jgi:hypothetical protein
MTQTTALKHQNTLIDLVNAHINTCYSFLDTVNKGNTNIAEMTASMAAIRDHVSHRQRPALREQTKKDQLAGWAAEAADFLRNHVPIVRKNQIVWRDNEGQLHTLFFTWYDDSVCVRMSLDHFTGYVFAAEAKQLGMKEWNLRGYTGVVPNQTTRLEMTTLPAEMSKALVWALGCVGESPCEWVKFGERNIWTVGANAAYRQSIGKK